MLNSKKIFFFNQTFTLLNLESCTAFDDLTCCFKRKFYNRFWHLHYRPPCEWPS